MLCYRKIMQYCKVINVCYEFIWWILWPSLNRKNKYWLENIVHVTRKLTGPELTTNINICKHSFCPQNANINPHKHYWSWLQCMHDIYSVTLLTMHDNLFLLHCEQVSVNPEAWIMWIWLLSHVIMTADKQTLLIMALYIVNYPVIKFVS